MYRCYLIHHGRIAKAEELNTQTLAEAVIQGRLLLSNHPETTPRSGIEIWQQTKLLYSDQCHASDSGIPADVVSPFSIPDSVMLPNGRQPGVPSPSQVTFV